MRSNLAIASWTGRGSRRRGPARGVMLLAALLLAALLSSCGEERPSVFSTASTSASVAGTERIPWDYRIVEGTVGDLIGSDMTILPDNALLPNDGNYATGDKIWTLQYMTADMRTNENGNSEIQLSSWTAIKSYKNQAQANADLANLKVSLETSVPLVGVYKTEYQGKTRNFAVLTLPSGNQIKQPIDDERYNKLKSAQKVMIKVEEVHDYSDYDMAYAKFRGWV